MKIDERADIIVQKIKHFLITHLGRLEKEATMEEFYHALCMIMKEEIMLHWSATLHTFDEEHVRMVYYLSMEYMPGRFLSNNITNVGAWDLLKIVLKKTNRNIYELLACESDPGIGNGGLGRLASCFLDSLATLQYPGWGYGLRYQYGIFDQEIWQGQQIERPDCWLLNENPWEMRKDLYSTSIYFRGNPIMVMNSHGNEVYHLEDYEEVRAIPYDYPIIGYSESRNFSVLPLRLWSTKESPKNFELQRFNAGQLDQAGENASLTDVLYPNDNNEMGKRIRLKQEFLLASASVQDIIRHHVRIYGDISSLADKVRIQINDTHPSLVIAELMQRLTTYHDIEWKHAWEMTQQICNYTNHTILKESLEEWNEKRMEYLLPRQYKIIQKLNLDFCNQIREKFPNDEGKVQRMTILHNGQIRMAHLAICGSTKVNGVATLHSELLKKGLFKDFADFYPDKFINITNGVTPRRWILSCDSRLSDFITARIGKKWIANLAYLQELANFAEDTHSQEQFLALKKNNKDRLIHFLTTENPIRDSKGKIIDHFPSLDSSALFDVQIKRIHEYKRQLLNALHLLMLYDEIKKDPKKHKIKRMVIIAGKAAPGYEIAKYIILLISLLSRKINNDPDVSPLLKVTFVENYKVSKAEVIIPAADLSEQISTAGTEASGTGNMKLTMNGALTIGTEDGANIEMKKAVTDYWWPFSFGTTIQEIQTPNFFYDPWQVCKNDPAIEKVLSYLKNDFLAQNDFERMALAKIYDSLLFTSNGMADKYLVLKDLRSYHETQNKVEELYAQPNLWAEYAIHNIAAMGTFSSDKVIENYAKEIWNIKPCPINPSVLRKIKEEYAEANLFSE
jgi:starch phosphorylase